ncbi:hypothetical protein GCM10027286_28680 [Virgibacillus ainsalahensis]
MIFYRYYTTSKPLIHMKLLKILHVYWDGGTGSSSHFFSLIERGDYSFYYVDVIAETGTKKSKSV